MIKRLLALLLFCFAIGQALHHFKDGFTPRRILPLSRPITENWDSEAEEALTQPFHYLGRGRQCFAFASADGKYVLKFPRTDIYKTPFWARLLPLASYRKNLEAKHKLREEFILDSFSLSFNELKEQTALLAIHLGTSPSRGKKLILIDALGAKHTLPLETAPFILQYKKPILMQAFTAAYNQGNRQEAEKILNALLSAITERAEKSILNRDRSFLRNYGYDGQRAYQIDVGSFFKSPALTPQAAYEKSLRDSVEPIQEWLTANAPDMLPHLEKILSR